MTPRCQNCNAFVDPNSRFCFNCGFDDPAQPTFVSKENRYTFSFTLVGALIIAAVITSIVAVITYRENPDELWRNIACSFLTSLFLGFLFSSMATAFIETKLASAAYGRTGRSAVAASLEKRKDDLLDRISELTGEYSHIESLKNWDHDESDQAAAIEEMRLKDLQSIINFETDVYYLQIREIELLRFRSDLYYLQKDANSLSPDETNESLELIEGVLETLGGRESEEAFTIAVEPEDVDRFWNRIDILEKDLNVKSGEIRYAYEELFARLERRADAQDSGVKPIDEAKAGLATPERPVSENPLRLYDELEPKYRGLIADLQSEFNRLNNDNEDFRSDPA